MLELVGVSKFYRGQPGNRDAAFRVKPGEIVGLIGPNNAEKQKLFRLLAGHLAPSSGTIRLHGADLWERRGQIGYLPASPPVLQELTVQTYVTVVAALRGVPAAQRCERVHTVLESVQLQHVASAYVGALSPGCQRRVGLAQAVIHEPELLILEDPIGGLYTTERLLIAQILRGLAQRRVVIINMEHEEEGRILCDRAVNLENGAPVEVEARRRWSHERRGFVRPEYLAPEERMGN